MKRQGAEPRCSGLGDEGRRAAIRRGEMNATTKVSMRRQMSKRVGPRVEPSPWLGREPSSIKTPKLADLGLLVRESKIPGPEGSKDLRPVTAGRVPRLGAATALPGLARCHTATAPPSSVSQPPTGRLHGHHFHLCSRGAVSQAATSQQAEPLYTADTPSKSRAFEFPPLPPSPPSGSPKSRNPLVSRTVLHISWMIRRPVPPWARCSVQGSGVTRTPTHGESKMTSWMTWSSRFSGAARHQWYRWMIGPLPRRR